MPNPEYPHMGRKQITLEEINEIGEDFLVQKMRILDIAKKFQRSRQGILLVLKKIGIPVSKLQQVAYACDMCGKEISVIASRVRKQKHVFCSMGCYLAWKEKGILTNAVLSRPVMELIRIMKAKEKGTYQP